MTRTTVTALFGERVAATPTAPALIAPDGSTLTYEELRDDAAAIAGGLRARGISGPIGVHTERCPEAVVLLLAILMAGGYYVPLDPAQPEQRLRHMAADSGIRVVVTTKDAPMFGGDDLTVVTLDELRGTSGGPPVTEPAPDDAAYLMYTSGSTGEPKGVVVAHSSVANLARSVTTVGITARDRLLHFAPLAFDASTFEIWAALCNGASVVVAPPGRLGVTELCEFVGHRSITVAWLSAGLFHELVALELTPPSSLRCLLAGGDVLRPEAVRALAGRAPRLELVNGYGPTECTTFTTLQPALSSVVTDTSPIGRPLPGVRAHVLTDDLRQVADGETGELYVAGAGLARGYHRRPAHTASRFLPNPFDDVPGSRMYRTGDLVRRRADGGLEFVGRVDRQVKVRGFRVEPGEIEAHLSGHHNVRDVAVLASHDDLGGARLTAYVVTKDSADDPVSAIRGWLTERVPEYLVPADFVVLPRLPLLPSGKLDVAALPRPSAPRQATTAMPETPMHQLVAETWQEVLRVPAVGPDDNFFELGGDSLRMNRVAARLHRAIGVPVSLADLLVAETAGELADYLSSLVTEQTPRTS